MTRQGKRLAAGGTADLYEWQDGRVLKLFRERADYYQNEIRATRVAHRLGLPVPVVEPDLVEVDGRRGIVMERVDGLTLTEYVNTHADGVADYARAMAELHAAIHDRLVPELLSYRQDVLEVPGAHDTASPVITGECHHRQEIAVSEGTTKCHMLTIRVSVSITKLKVKAHRWSSNME